MVEGSPPTTLEQIDAERDRRLAHGFTADVGRVSVPVDTRNGADWINLIGLALYAQKLVADGHGTSTMAFRGADNRVYTLSAAEIVELGQQAMAHKSMIYGKAWSLKDTAPIPADYQADAYWT